MLEKVPELILGAILSVIASVLLEPHLKRIFKIKYVPKHDGDEPLKAELAPAPNTPDRIEEWRRKNRERLSARMWEIFLYSFSIYILFLAFYIPALFKMTNKELLLSTTRLNLNYEIADDKTLILSILLAVLVYFPCLDISENFGAFASRIYGRYEVIDIRKRTLFTLSGVVVLAIAISSLVVYLLYPGVTYKQALVTPVGVIMLLFALANYRQ